MVGFVQPQPDQSSSLKCPTTNSSTLARWRDADIKSIDCPKAKYFYTGKNGFHKTSHSSKHFTLEQGQMGGIHHPPPPQQKKQTQGVLPKHLQNC